MRKWLFAIVFLLASLVASLVILDRAGVLDTGEILTGRLGQMPVLGKYVGTYELGRKTSEALARARQELEEKGAQLDRREAELAKEAAELESQREALRRAEEELARQRDALAEREAALAERESYEERVAWLRQLYGEMRPNEAADRLLALDESTALAILKGLPQEAAARIFAAMPPDRSARFTLLLLDTANQPEGR